MCLDSYAIMQLMQLPAESRISINPRPQTREWHSFLRTRPELGSTHKGTAFGQWQITQAKYRASVYNARVEKMHTDGEKRARDPPPAPPVANKGPEGGAGLLVGVARVRRAGYDYMGQLMDCEIDPGKPRCTYTGGHIEWQCFLPATTVHPLGPAHVPIQQLCTVHYVSQLVYASFTSDIYLWIEFAYDMCLSQRYHAWL
jgi:hypothetical protein